MVLQSPVAELLLLGVQLFQATLGRGNVPLIANPLLCINHSE